MHVSGRTHPGSHEVQGARPPPPPANDDDADSKKTRQNGVPGNPRAAGAKGSKGLLDVTA